MTLYDFCHLTFPWVFKIWLRCEVYGRENIPAEGPVVIASNHLSLLDPPVLGAAARCGSHTESAFYGKIRTFQTCLVRSSHP